MDDELRALILGSIHADRLVVLCGAGLSMGSPTCLHSARGLAVSASTEYERITGTSVPPEAREDLEALAGFLISRDQLRTLFLSRLVPWAEFRRRPNPGHHAVADFLICGAIDFALSTNYDTHIEDAAADLGERDLHPSLDGDEANIRSMNQRPLLKLHGCCVRDRANTVWHPDQLDEPELRDRLTTIEAWLLGHLRGRDLLILGFWSDWRYLNAALWSMLAKIDRTEPRKLILVDPAKTAALEAKAPELWSWATENPLVSLHHVQTTAEYFLDELRSSYSRQFLLKVLDKGREFYPLIIGRTVEPENRDTFDHLDSAALYDLRRDATGQGPSEPVRKKNPDDAAQMLGALQVRLLEVGATIEGSLFKFNGNLYQIMHGNGQPISRLKAKYLQNPTARVRADVVICALSVRDLAATDVIRVDTSSSVVRPGLPGTWVTDKEAWEILGELHVTH